LLLGYYYISQHALEQYSGRVFHKGETETAIKRDLKTLNIRNIVRTETNIHLFTKNSKEFIFVKTKRGLCLKTVIKRNSNDNKKTIDKRKALSK
jgi:hypothetical protein